MFRALGRGRSHSAHCCLRLLFLSLLALFAITPPALAVDNPQYSGVSFGPEGTAGTATFADVQGVAIDQASEDVYVYDAGAEGGGKVYKFDATGHPVDFAATSTNSIEGIGGAIEPGAEQIAVAPAGAPGGTAGDIYVANNQVVKVYAETGEPLGEFGEGETCGVTTDPDGNVLVGVYEAGEASVIREYLPTSNPPLNSDQTAVSGAGLPEICNVGVDSQGAVYATAYATAPPFETGLQRLAKLTASERSTLDSASHSLAVQPTTNVVYANQESRVVEYGPSGRRLIAFAETGSGAISGSHGVAVNATVGLPASGDVYVSSGTGQVEIFSPAPLAEVSAGPVTGLSATSATIAATVDPEGIAVESCTVEYGINGPYGTEPTYGSSVACQGSLPVDDVGHEVTASLTGLQPGTPYHYRIVVTNRNGSNESGDQSLMTLYPPSAACPNEAFRVGPPVPLSDCRAYEQVSPTDKHGANIAHDVNLVQASASGDGLTFADPVSLPTSGGTSYPTDYAALRGPNGWATNGLLPPTDSGSQAGLLGWDQEIDASASAVNSSLSEIKSTLGSIDLGDTAAGTFATALSTPEGLIGPYLASFAGPHQLLFEVETANPLVPGAAPGVHNLYELDHGAISLPGRIPPGAATSCDDAVPTDECEPASEGAFAGPYDWEESNPNRGGAGAHYYTQDTISADGSKVFFTTRGDGQLYVREGGTTTRRISAPETGVTDPNGQKPAAFMAATPSGSEVVFASCEKLTADSTAVSTTAETCTGSEQGQDLYVYDTASHRLTDLTVDHEPSDATGAAIQGVLGTSADGSDVYFVANGVLTGEEEKANGERAEPGSCSIGGNTGTCNLYLSHAGTTTFIGHLDAEVENGDQNDWRPWFEAVTGSVKTSRVSADGTLVFTSAGSLTGYDNSSTKAGIGCPGSEVAGYRCPEIFRYQPSPPRLDCVSCSPRGLAPIGPASLESRNYAYGSTPQTALLTRNVSADGDRVFFDSPDPLVPTDTDGEAGCRFEEGFSTFSCTDVYEWEAPDPADPTDSCHSVGANGGCLYLISGGDSPDPSFLGDISASGDDAFFFTAQSLVPADKDQLVDAYDARVAGGLASQYAAVPPPCLEAGVCRGPGAAVPGQPLASTSTFTGPANPTPPKARKCPKGKVKKHGRCVKKPKKKKHKHKNRGARMHKKTGQPRRGGSK